MYNFYALVASLLLAAPTLATYTLVDHFAGSTFFNNFTFFTAVDPTAGAVNYVPLVTALAEEYVGLVNDSADSSSDTLFKGTDSVYIGVDHTTTLPNNTDRDSVRITSQPSWTHGLFVIDILHAPTGCGLWPSIWMVNASGPYPGTTGEIDIFEGVNAMTANAMTLHTDAGCSVNNKTIGSSKNTLAATNSTSSTDTFLGTLAYEDCNVNAAGQPDNVGCSITAPTTSPAVNTASRAETASSSNDSSLATAGAAFNAQGGGVYALYWTSNTIQIYLFAHSSLPSGLTSGAPDPASWASTYTPLARFEGCDFDAHLGELSLVINIDFCGGWPDSVWSSGGCAASTGMGSCVEFVASRPEALGEAYWVLRGMDVYQDLD